MEDWWRHQHIFEFDRKKKNLFPYLRYEKTFFKLFFIFSHRMFTPMQGTAHFGVLVFLQQHSNRWQHHYLDKSYSRALQSLTGRGGKRTHILHSSRWTDTVVKMKKKKKKMVKILIQLPYSSRSYKVQALNCTQSIKVQSLPLKDISSGHSCAKLTEPQGILT